MNAHAPTYVTEMQIQSRH